jgi:hypothetical protein
MTMPSARGSSGRGTFLLADISGYTGFLHGVAEAHRAIIIETDEPPAAYAVLSNLLDAMLDVVAPPFRLVKFEGDALFAVADEPGVGLRGQAVLESLRSCHGAFSALLAEAGTAWTCSCEACARVHELGLKLILHHGEYVAQRIAGREELAGPDVILAHRLLKNHVRDVIGTRPYALFTAEAVAELELPTDGFVAAQESYDGLPTVGVHILPLG